MSNEKGKSGSDGPTDTQDEPKEAMKESEILLLQRYGTFIVLNEGAGNIAPT